jgi:hypothetical protein
VMNVAGDLWVSKRALQIQTGLPGV